MSFKKNAKNEEIKVVDHDVVVTRAHEFEDGSVTFSIDVNGVSINGCRWCEGEKDGKDYEFVSFPSYKGKNDKYYSHAYVRLSDSDITTIKNMLEKILNPE